MGNVEVEEVKKLLQIKTNHHDEYLETMIPLLVEWIKDYTNNSFTDTKGVESLPGGVCIFIAKACEHNMQKAGLKARSMGEVSYTYNLDFPNTLTRFLRPYKRLRFI